MEIQDIFYPCKFDGTMQPAKFQPASGPEPRPLVVCLHTQKELSDKVATCLAEVRSRGAEVFLITSYPSQTLDSLSDFVVRLPDLCDLFSPVGKSGSSRLSAQGLCGKSANARSLGPTKAT